jgi:hypothetical protein
VAKPGGRFAAACRRIGLRPGRLIMGDIAAVAGLLVVLGLIALFMYKRCSHH